MNFKVEVLNFYRHSAQYFKSTSVYFPNGNVFPNCFRFLYKI